jgi:hypothetical protein
VAQHAARLCNADGPKSRANYPNPMTGSGAQSAQPLLPPDQPGAQPQGQTGQVTAPVQGPQNAMQNAPQTGMQNGRDPLANQTNDQQRWRAKLNAPFQGISQPTKNAADIFTRQIPLHLSLREAVFEGRRSWLNKLARAQRPRKKMSDASLKLFDAQTQ